MAPNATIFKAALHIADVDRHYYEDHTVTLARHPSETMGLACQVQEAAFDPQVAMSR